MMEDILALVVVALAVAIMTFIVYRVVKRNRQAAAEYKARQASLDEKLAEMKRETTRKLRADEAARAVLRKHPNYGSPEFDPKNPDVLKPRETIVQQKSRFRTEEVRARREEVTPAPVNNWSTDLLTTMVIADMLTSHNNVSASPSYSKPSTDFGFDDSDSRKSASSSFSSSDSSSSWSDSSSSSSDSGPSSDW